MKVDKEYKLAYHTVVTALSCETNGKEGSIKKKVHSGKNDKIECADF